MDIAFKAKNLLEARDNLSRGIICKKLLLRVDYMLFVEAEFCVILHVNNHKKHQLL